ncbi:MAG TPA: hydrogenase maturation protease, partial [Acidimicrobiales bacterium]|nr:hydrogenase maturation protease [Acidimicrobiales bacterium]
MVTSDPLARPHIVVIGVGNPFRRDDGAGPEVARRVRAATPSWVDVVEHDGEPAGLLDVWEGADLAVVVDAVRSHARSPGYVHRVLVEATTGAGAQSGVSSHAGGPGNAVALARALDRMPARLVLYGIEGDTFSAGV